jgi:hypothetical protein
VGDGGEQHQTLLQSRLTPQAAPGDNEYLTSFYEKQAAAVSASVGGLADATYIQQFLSARPLAPNPSDVSDSQEPPDLNILGDSVLHSRALHGIEPQPINQIFDPAQGLENAPNQLAYHVHQGKAKDLEDSMPQAKRVRYSLEPSETSQSRETQSSTPGASQQQSWSDPREGELVPPELMTFL